MTLAEARASGKPFRRQKWVGQGNLWYSLEASLEVCRAIGPDVDPASMPDHKLYLSLESVDADDWEVRP